MYFITNSEGLIIAASENFLSAIGSREICSITTMLQDKSATLDSVDLKLSIPSKNLEYNYSVSNLHSALGKLSLYSLEDIKEDEVAKEEEDENIAYLKKIKEGQAAKSDNEYDIPEIPTLMKDSVEQETALDEHKNETIEDKIKESIKDEPTSEVDTNEILKVADYSNDEAIDKLADEIVEEKEKSKSDITLDLEEALEKIGAKNNVEDSELLTVADEESNNSLAEAIKAIEVESDKKEESLELQAKDIAKEAEVDTSNLDNKDTINVPEIPKEALEQELKEQESEKIVKIESSLEEADNKEVSKESRIKKITKKLFPWGNKEDKDIDLEEENYEIDLKTACEIKDKDGATEIESIIDKTKEVTVEPINNLEEETTEDIDLIKSIDNKKDEIADTLSKSQVKGVEKKESINEVAELLKEDTKEKEENLEIENTIAKIESIDTVDKIEKISEEPKEQIVTKENDKIVEEDSKVLYKLIGLKVDKLDFNSNAHKLNIDTNSYKMLLNNYLDEIEKYRADLENGSSSTIDMLKDAGELLSVDMLAQELAKLKSRDDRSKSLKEILLISSLIKEKMETSDTSSKENSVKDISFASKIEHNDLLKEETNKTQEIIVPPIPNEFIDITTAEDLLSSINAKKVNFDLNIVHEELNLPKSLIMDFVNDFIVQAKEHLSELVKYYNEKNLEALHKEAHSMKGAAGNLRLGAIAETLFKIQKSSDIESNEELIKKYVAELKGLEQEVASMEDADNED